jgi:vitamin K-dependent gamma-carboxylase
MILAIKLCLDRVRARLGVPVDAASLAVVRIGFGTLMLFELWRHFSLGRIERYFVQPRLLFPYYGFGWLEPLSATNMRLLFAVLMLLSVLIALGLAYRWASLLFFFGYSYTFLLDQSNYQNHLYLHCLLAFLLACVDANRALSVDALLDRRGNHFVPLWQVRLVAFQLALPYAFGGLNKLSAQWLSGAAQALELAPMARHFDLPFLATPLASKLTAWGGLCIDLLAVPLLCTKRGRLPMYLVLLVFHLTNSQLFSIGVFPWFMIVATTLFFPPDWPRRLLDRLRRPSAPLRSCGEQKPVSGLTLGLLCGYAALQVLLPVRRVFYPGDTTWRHEARYFSWDMKLNVRRGDIALLARDREGRAQPIPLERFLTPKQIEHLSYTPDMVVIFSKFATARLPPGGQHTLHWSSRLSLNGAPPRPFIVEDAAFVARQEVSLWPTAIVRAR